MTPAEVLDELTGPLVAVADGVAIRDFLVATGPPPPGASPDGPSFFRRLVRVARQADRRTTASAAGHQAAIRRLFPAAPPAAVVAFCISEDKGPRPAHIHTNLRPADDALNGFVLNGHKRFGSMAPDADSLYVAASIGRSGAHGEHNQLHMVTLPTDRAGITTDRAAYVDYGPDMSICDLAFDNVAIAAHEVHDGDGYLDFIKPFRLIEDVYNTASTQIGLFQLGRRLGWPDEPLEDLLALVVQASAIAETDMASAEAVLVLSAYLRASEAHWNQLWGEIAQGPHGIASDLASRWQPDRNLLGIAAAARETRRQQAWAELRSLACRGNA